ncbi:MAG: alpha/beta hydrolase, partial [Sphingopyxis sp.]|nr:alpha/beta hydrolase [Sphingopyxis sp.]
AVNRCRRSLEAVADLTKYGTREAVADLDDVRTALGYKAINLFALSYGTTVALRYLESHPTRVRAAVLMGVSPPSATPPKMHALAGERALNLLIDRCQTDLACSNSFDPGEDIERVRTEVGKLEGAPPLEIFFEKLRSLMYSPTGARMVPYILSRAATGDLEPFYQATRPRGPSPYADGMFLSVICSEGMALMDLAAARQSANATLFGDYRLRRQAEACSNWPVSPLDDDFLDPVKSDIPLLFISGEWDPVTPPELADQVVSNLTNAKHVIIPGSGHIFDGMSGIETCLDPLVLGFFETATFATFDDSCVAKMEPPEFLINLRDAVDIEN